MLGHYYIKCAFMASSWWCSNLNNDQSVWQIMHRSVMVTPGSIKMILFQFYEMDIFPNRKQAECQFPPNISNPTKVSQNNSGFDIFAFEGTTWLSQTHRWKNSSICICNQHMKGKIRKIYIIPNLHCCRLDKYSIHILSTHPRVW